ncbi:MAG: isoprenylcysteine carboxylmethyltransferase family protein [Candidatus Nomurabacteria bacterium]|nr:MAG: isoprenylcysteine carboxylmethyltransferase family protein [Candidatus Nomurabacteria bacterium]
MHEQTVDHPFMYTLVAGIWIVFWLSWIVLMFSAKRSTHKVSKNMMIRIVIIATALIVMRLGHFDSGATLTHNMAVRVVGTTMVILGLGFAVWARVHIGRNWSMPKATVEDRDLVTSGPYHYVRHPIYSGLLLALVGTVMSIGWYIAIILVVFGSYFVSSALTEEHMLAREFPKAYPAYRAKTKMLIPFIW